MAQVTIVPLDDRSIEICCGDTVVRFVVPFAANGGPAGGGSKDGDSSDGSTSDGGVPGTGGGPRAGGTGGSVKAPGGDTSAGPNFYPPPSPIFYPPPVIPLFVGQRAGDLLHGSFTRVGSTEHLSAVAGNFANEIGSMSSDQPRHLVVFLDQQKIDLHEIARPFSNLPDRVQVTIYLTQAYA